MAAMRYALEFHHFLTRATTQKAPLANICTQLKYAFFVRLYGVTSRTTILQYEQ